MSQSEPTTESSGDWYGEETATFGDRLAGAREGAGLSQTELATRLGVRIETLRKWENDQAEPRANRLQMLAGMLGVSLTWMITGRGDGPQAPGETPVLTPELRALLDEMRVLRGQMAEAAAVMTTLETRLRRALSQQN